jgi:virulence-associated protein VapD
MGAGIGHNSGTRTGGRQTVYAITFDLDTKVLEATYASSPSWQNAYSEIGRFLRGNGFERQQGSVYFGNDTVDAVSCQLAVQRLALQFQWFAPSVRDIWMLRIEDNNDLMPAIELVAGLRGN